VNTVRPFLAIFIVISLVSMQASGIHLHVNAAGAGGFHGTHVHEADLNDHGHIGDTDVSLFELIRSVNQTFPFIAAFILSLLVVTRYHTHLWAFDTGLLRPRRRSRWRPPLRAPPLPLSWS